MDRIHAFHTIRRLVALLLFSIAAASAITGTARASVVQCIAPDGSVTYQDSTCTRGAKGRPVDTTPNSGGRFATEREIREAREALRAPPPEHKTVARAAGSKSGSKQALNPDERRFIQIGMSEADVRQRIGAPDHVVRKSAGSTGKRDRNKPSSVQWVYLPAQDDAQTTTTLTLKGGVVKQVERRVTR